MIDEAQENLKRYHAYGFKFLFNLFFPTLDFDYISGMNEIGVYGKEKYGDQSFDVKRKSGNLTRDMNRVSAPVIAAHAYDHLVQANSGIKHDKFGTIEHQHYAAGFNAMMENIFWKAEQVAPVRDDEDTFLKDQWGV